MSTSNRSVIIVGAGICGITSAIELRKRGFIVQLFDPGPLPHPQAASNDISKMIRMDYGTDELYMSLMLEAFPLWHEWNRQWGKTLYHEEGWLLLTRGEMKPGSFEYANFERLQQHGQPLERISAGILKQRFPAWNSDLYTDGYYNPRAGWAEADKVMDQLFLEAQSLGVQFHADKKVEYLLERGSRVIGVVANGKEKHFADSVIVAAGSWTPRLLPYLSDVMWATGQSVFHFRPDNPEQYKAPHFVAWAADIATTGWYGFPANDQGILKVANHGVGRRLYGNEERIVDPREEQRTRDFLKETFPALADVPLVSTRLCAYCDTWDGNFWIDRDPDRAGLVVVAGDSGHGFKFAPLIGKWVADIVDKEEPLTVKRFAWRSRGQLKTEDARAMA